MERFAFSTKLSKEAISKLIKVKVKTGIPYNRQIEEAILGSD